MILGKSYLAYWQEADHLRSDQTLVTELVASDTQMHTHKDSGRMCKTEEKPLSATQHNSSSSSICGWSARVHVSHCITHRLSLPMLMKCSKSRGVMCNGKRKTEQSEKLNVRI